MKQQLDFFQPLTASDRVSLQITDEAEACASVLMACLRANEIDHEADKSTFLAVIRSRNIFIGHDPAYLIDMAGRNFDQAGSSAALIDAAIHAIRDQTRLPLFYHCLDVILSDGLVTPRENQVFQYLKRKFKVDDETAFKAMDVLVVKNQL